MAFLLVIAFPVFDRRFAWSSTSPAVNVVGDFLIAIGFYVVFLVFKTNTFASALIDVESDQQVVTTAPTRSCAIRCMPASHIAPRRAARARQLVGGLQRHPNHCRDRLAAVRRRKIPRAEFARLHGILRQGPLALDAGDLLTGVAGARCELSFGLWPQKRVP